MTSWLDQFKSNKKMIPFFNHISLLSKRTQEGYLYKVKEICDSLLIPYFLFDPFTFNQEQYDKVFFERAKTMKKTSLNGFSGVMNLLSKIYRTEIKTKRVRETDKFTDHVTYEEFQKILKETDSETAALSAFLFGTGLRTISVVSITKSQLIFNSNPPYIKNVYLKGGKREDVVILFPNIVIPRLQWYMQFKSTQLKDYEKIEKVFVSQKGESTEFYIYYVIKKCSKILGRPVHPRMFRKGLGIFTKKMGMQDAVRQSILHHKNVRTTIEAYSDYGMQDIVREFEEKVVPRLGNESTFLQSNNQFPQNQQNHIPQIPIEYCPYCKSVIEPDMLYCTQCWKQIKRICSNCKKFIKTNWKMCPYCGAKSGSDHYTLALSPE